MILQELSKLLGRDRIDAGISLLESMSITNDMFKEHLMELCLNKKIIEAFDKLTTQQKSAFTRAWNASHKDPTQGVRGKTKAKK